MRLVSLMGRLSGGVRGTLRGWARYQTGKQIGAMRQQGEAGLGETMKRINSLIYRRKMLRASTVAKAGAGVAKGVSLKLLISGSQVRALDGPPAKSTSYAEVQEFQISQSHQ